MIDLRGLLHHRRGGGEDFLAIPGQRRINPLAVNKLLGLLRRFAGRDDPAVPPQGWRPPNAANAVSFAKGAPHVKQVTALARKRGTETTSPVSPVPLETCTAHSILLVYHSDCSTHPGMEAALEEVNAYA
jgi:hypothetical protein